MKDENYIDKPKPFPSLSDKPFFTYVKVPFWPNSTRYYDNPYAKDQYGIEFPSRKNMRNNGQTQRKHITVDVVKEKNSFELKESKNRDGEKEPLLSRKGKEAGAKHPSYS